MPLNKPRELFRGHQPVDEVTNVQVVIKRDVLLEGAVDVAGILGNHCQHPARAFGK